ncbi:MAG: proline--tRNA ligase [Candidatus Dormibacteraeota bacterium]|uniref:Proline--tRNA ligase n=1 Tax=Candidatus Amunia macphersoniae TaxID=3127014 RepID=A0A934N9N6_9BACT|nr:proline--tRNA ligase [Candidatus Dormibacteraeota bacterium]
MPTPALRLAHLFGQTLRTAPSDAESEGHQLLLRAGFVRPLAAGIFSLLPLGWRSLRRIESVVREEMDAIGGQEMAMPVVHPAEIWQRSGRWHSVGRELVRFQDRGGRDMVLAMTHEEIVTDLASREILSWRQLPMVVYQLQTKFRDEPRSRMGLIRVREFTMKDSYSFDRDVEGLQRAYDAHHAAYMRIFERCGLGNVVAVEGDMGMMGGLRAHELMYPTPIGEDTLVRCTACGDSANQQVARFAKTAEDNGAARDLERVATPGMATIKALATFLEVSPTQTAKAVFFTADCGDRGRRLVMALVRGDHDVEETKLGNAVSAHALMPATSEEIRAVGAEPGYASPIGVDRELSLVVIDDLLAQSANLVAGANEVDVHFRNVNVGRDFEADVVADIAAAADGAVCVRCGGPLELFRGVEVGNIFQLGTRYSADLGAVFTDEHGAQHPLVMGSYGIGIGRLLACVAEEHHDDRGLRLPPTVAPVDVHVVVLDELAREPADTLVAALETANVSVLVDDRSVSAGVKFADADLIGAPVRCTLSKRSLAAGGVEVRNRADGATTVESEHTAAATVVARCRGA